MKIPEAIANLNHIYGFVSPDIQRSLDMAIKALERSTGDIVDEKPLNRKTFDEHELGEIIVRDYGICKIVKVDDYAGYTTEMIIPKDVFVEAYKMYIKGGAE